ncbi:LysR family transcriptional regulator [Rheinheimera marina]|uniref:LysR family transcriptional regulator n=1 Tax=Rheinheimera marina TaxID=1774958 RepID=A0ABV9JM59_9GAMM
MNLRRLEHLVALAEERHFGRAAERVHLSQPAFSRSIQALEQETNLRLFEREAAEVRPTPAGEFLLERAYQILLVSRGLQNDLQLYGRSQLGSLAFGIGPFPAAMVMHQVVPKLRQQLPALALRIEIYNWNILLDRLRQEDIEFFIADSRSFIAEQDVLIQPLAIVPGGFFVRPDHPLAGQNIRMQQLLPFGVATTRLPAETRALVASAFGLASGDPLPVVLECDDIALLRTVAMQSDTILGVIHGSVAAALAEGELVELQVSDQPELLSSFGVIRMKHRSQSPSALRVIAEVEAVLRQMGADLADTGSKPG